MADMTDLSIDAILLAKSRLEEQDARIAALEEALREVSQSLAWLSFGECRGYSVRLLSSNQALRLARSVLNKETSRA